MKTKPEVPTNKGGDETCNQSGIHKTPSTPADDRLSNPPPKVQPSGGGVPAIGEEIADLLNRHSFGGSQDHIHLPIKEAVSLIDNAPQIRRLNDAGTGFMLKFEQLEKDKERLRELIFAASELLETVPCDCKWDGGHQPSCAIVKCKHWRDAALNQPPRSPDK